MDGWIKLHRKLYDHWIFSCRDCLMVWMFLLIRANHKKTEVVVGNQLVKLNPGQLVTGRKSIAEKTGINESKIVRILKRFKSEQLIEHQTFSKFSIISITKWHDHQVNEQQNEQQMNNKRTASEQQVNTDKNVKNEENEKKKTVGRFTPPTIEEVKEYAEYLKYDFDADKFWHFYNSKNWMVGRNKMTDWKSAVVGWNTREAKNKKPKHSFFTEDEKRGGK